MLEAMQSAADQLFSVGPIIAILIVIPIALINGMLMGPGVPVFILLLTIGLHFDPFIALPAAIAYAAANDASEPIPSILMGIPASRGSQATILDGYPLARQGRAGYALGATYLSSLIGGLIGAAALMAAIPVAREVLRLFGSAEFFLLSIFGIMTVAILSSGQMLKGLLAGTFALALALIGFSPIGGDVRATFGIDYLWDGLPLVPVLLGLFAVPELAEFVVRDKPISAASLDQQLKDSRRQVREGMVEALRHKFLILKSALIGTFMGMLPGLGAAPAHWIAYSAARQTEKGAKKTFGKGDIRGVIAAETSNNAIDGGVLIPTLFFAIPGSTSMAIVLGFMVIKGVQPGSEILETHLDLTLALAWTIVLANIIVVPIMLRFAHLIARISVIPPNILTPIVMGLVVVAIFQERADFRDLYIFAGAAVLGLFMKAYGWPRPPVILALVLAEPIEKYLHISLSTMGWGMFSRPQFIIMLLIMLGFLALGFVSRKSAADSEAEVVGHGDAPSGARAAEGGKTRDES